MTDFVKTVHQTYPLLSWAAGYNIALLAVSLVGLAVDPRQVTGVNPWIKPIKFEISIVIYAMTIAWMLMNLRASANVKQFLAAGVAVTMAAEITAIVLQAARGVKSHFNTGTPFDGAVFAVMGVMIVLNTALLVWLLALYFRPHADLAPAVVWGIRLGLIVFLLASAEGFLMINRQGHTVGAPDGGPGLLFLNWHTQFGDLRVAHFVGIHAIQLLPLLGWLVSRTDRTAGTAWVAAAFVVLLAIFTGTLVQALAGRPLVRAGGAANHSAFQNYMAGQKSEAPDGRVDQTLAAQEFAKPFEP